MQSTVRKHISVLLSGLMALTTLSTPMKLARADDDPSDVAQMMVAQVEAKARLVRSAQCLPPEGTENEEAWLEQHPLSPRCFKLVLELQELYNNLEDEYQAQATELLHQEGDLCQSPVSESAGPDAENLQNLENVAEKSACTEERKAEIWRTCSYDFLCVLASTSAGTVLGPDLTNMLMPASFKAQGCDAKKDNCMEQIVLGFVKSVVSLMEGVWDLLKMAGRGIANKAIGFWEWVTDAETNSSTAQLAAAKISEDDGIFKMLVDDFSGSMTKLWSGLMAALKEWLANNVFCQEWAGVPQFSECKRPASGADCLECKTMLTGLCVAGGTILAEIVPAFLTGGLVTCMKHGVSAAPKLAKLLKVSSKAIKAIQETPTMAKLMRPIAKTAKVLRLSEVATASLKGLKKAVSILGTHLLSPTLQMLKKSLQVMSRLAQKSKTFVMLTPAGTVIAFGWKGLASTGKVVILPFENALTTKSFKLGEDFFEKLIQKSGQAKVFGGLRPVLTGEAARLLSLVDEAYVEFQVAKYVQKGDPELVLAAERKYLETLKKHRPAILEAYLESRPNATLSKIINEFFPELTTIKKGKNVIGEDIEKGKAELLAAINKISNNKEKARLIADYEKFFKTHSGEVTLPRGPPSQLERSEFVAQLDGKSATTFEHIVEEHYPELLYQSLGKQLGPEKLLEAEKELFESLNKIQDLSLRNSLLEKYNAHVSSKLRSNVVNIESEFFPENVIRNASLSDEERLEKSFKLLGLEKDHPHAQKIRQAILDAHNVGRAEGGGVYTYTTVEIAEKKKILEKADLTPEQIKILLRSGLAGRPPLREIVRHTGSFFNDHAASLLERNYNQRKEEVRRLLEQSMREKYKKKKFIKRLLTTKEERMAKAQAAQINDNLDALYFIDYKHTQQPFLEMLFQKKEVGSLQLFETYERRAFDNYQDARNFLASESPPITKDTLLTVHQQMMKGGIEEVSTEQLGKIRDGAWYGNVPKGYEISDDVVKNINDNPYLTWVAEASENGKNSGQIFYPNFYHVKEEALLLIKDSHPNVYKLVQDYKRTGIGDPNEITRQLVEALTEERIERFNKLRAKLGNLDTPEKLEKYVDLIADFQRDLVSIHPLANGNGRSTREFALYYLLTKEGFPPPRIIDPNADIYFSATEWRQIIKHGMLASDHLVEDVAERLRFNLPLENSLELFSPYTRPGIPLPLKKQGSKVVSSTNGVEYIDPRIYREIIKRNPNLAQKLQSDPVAAWDEIHKEVTEVFKKNNTYYIHNKNGLERLELGFIDDDFTLMFGRNTFSDVDAYKFKMKTWYEEDITWRGLASTAQEKTEKEIIAMFKHFNSHMASNAVLQKLPAGASPEHIRLAALEDFKQYNDDVFGDGLVRLAKDHSETGPLYGRSYGYSTSKNREVGKAFAMGAMVVGKYGEHKLPELQAMLKSRVLVGARRARKDVDLGRLKQLREDFSYKYGRQQEVMGIGAAEPDALSIIQTIDASGEVILSYLRNPDTPSQIWVVKGDIKPGQTPEAKDILKIVDLTK